jgi:hypothetical protein
MLILFFYKSSQNLNLFHSSKCEMCIYLRIEGVYFLFFFKKPCPGMCLRVDAAHGNGRQP